MQNGEATSQIVEKWFLPIPVTSVLILLNRILFTIPSLDRGVVGIPTIPTKLGLSTNSVH